ncbi:MAG: helix-turn-helix domain-containing protein, partial [Planctomycetota bacterium]|nr:helix-turn-helix domain-containing protein [Planctomycetota bacterium]
MITRARLSAHEKAVLWVLWDFENSRTGLAWPSLDTVAACAAISRRSVINALRLLVQTGVLSTQRRGLGSALRRINSDALARLVPDHALTRTSEGQTVHTEGQAVHTEGQTVHTEGQPVHTEGHRVPSNRRRTQEEKKREHAPPTFLSASRKDPKARHPGASDVSMNDLSHEEF